MGNAALDRVDGGASLDGVDGGASLDRVDGGASLDGNYLIYPIYPIYPIRPIFPILPVVFVVFVVLFSLSYPALIFSAKAVGDDDCYLAIWLGAFKAEIVAMWGCRAV